MPLTLIIGLYSHISQHNPRSLISRAPSHHLDTVFAIPTHPYKSLNISTGFHLIKTNQTPKESAELARQRPIILTPWSLKEVIDVLIYVRSKLAAYIDSKSARIFSRAYITGTIMSAPPKAKNERGFMLLPTLLLSHSLWFPSTPYPNPNVYFLERPELLIPDPLKVKDVTCGQCETFILIDESRI